MITNVFNYDKLCYELKKIDEKIVSPTYEKVVDDSRFHPNVDGIHNMGSDVNGTNSQPIYDFSDGKDTGLRLYGLTDPSLDITEVEAIKNRIQAQVDSATEKAKIEVAEKLKSVRDKKSSDTSQIDSTQTN